MTFNVDEKTTAWYRGELKDKDDTKLDDTNIASMTITLYDKISGTIINSKNAYDVRNSGSWDRGTTVDSSRTLNLEIRLDPLDNIIYDTTIPNGMYETHVLLIEGTTSGSPSFSFKQEVEFNVRNLNKVS